MFRERLTITLEPELVAAIDSLIDKRTLRNRSQTIEYLLTEGLGLHLLEHAFLFFDPTWQQSQLEAVIKLCTAARIRHFFLVMPTHEMSKVPEITTILHGAITDESIQITPVPADFGTGGALMLQKEKLTQPFLIVHLGEQLHLPTSLLPPYVFHRQHHGPLTQLLTETGSNKWQSAGIEIAEPELIHRIPAGIVSLEESVYPLLVQENNVRAYVFSH